VLQKKQQQQQPRSPPYFVSSIIKLMPYNQKDPNMKERIDTLIHVLCVCNFLCLVRFFNNVLLGKVCFKIQNPCFHGKSFFCIVFWLLFDVYASHNYCCVIS
jgi:hypothetical protein